MSHSRERAPAPSQRLGAWKTSRTDPSPRVQFEEARQKDHQGEGTALRRGRSPIVVADDDPDTKTGEKKPQEKGEPKKGYPKGGGKGKRGRPGRYQRRGNGHRPGPPRSQPTAAGSPKETGQSGDTRVVRVE